MPRVGSATWHVGGGAAGDRGRGACQLRTLAPLLSLSLECLVLQAAAAPEEEVEVAGASYEYLLSMALSSLTREKVEALQKVSPAGLVEWVERGTGRSCRA